MKENNTKLVDKCYYQNQNINKHLLVEYTADSLELNPCEQLPVLYHKAVKHLHS